MIVLEAAGWYIRRMHRLRALAVFLILTLIASPAMAAACAIDCVSRDAVTTALPGGMQSSTVSVADDHATMHCHDDTVTADSKAEPAQPDTSHAACTMAGCHGTTAAGFASASVVMFDYTPVHSAGLLASQISADLPPPIKPPA